jgi:hypothetical protein
MAFTDSCLTVSVPANSDLSTKQYYCVEVGSTGKVTLANADTDFAFLLQNKPTTTGEPAEIAVAGIAKGIAGGAITPGTRVAPLAANGKLQAAASGDEAIGIYVGDAAAADGDVIAVLLTGHTLLA